MARNGVDDFEYLTASKSYRRIGASGARPRN